ncbi:hypothetical protein CONLIGDRAFT_64940 [Coniochaeta ligniaria NRRL 30616]|uniref:Uncharacterized protein n=1 Tax=Coniochaeta ligniaria NRRL 30616 TaxID=1408157 RepID=A0A1J7J8E7_9PEZI|nr:hypothetical protein CONLIGDRAFT_64940 [Coniochaeta ligniaria NRRL 30616]
MRNPTTGVLQGGGVLQYPAGDVLQIPRAVAGFPVQHETAGVGTVCSLWSLPTEASHCNGSSSVELTKEFFACVIAVNTNRFISRKHTGFSEISTLTGMRQALEFNYAADRQPSRKETVGDHRGREEHTGTASRARPKDLAGTTWVCTYMYAVCDRFGDRVPEAGVECHCIPTALTPSTRAIQDYIIRSE